MYTSAPPRVSRRTRGRVLSSIPIVPGSALYFAGMLLPAPHRQPLSAARGGKLSLTRQQMPKTKKTKRQFAAVRCRTTTGLPTDQPLPQVAQQPHPLPPA